MCVPCCDVIPRAPHIYWLYISLNEDVISAGQKLASQEEVDPRLPEKGLQGTGHLCRELQHEL